MEPAPTRAAQAALLLLFACATPTGDDSAAGGTDDGAPLAAGCEVSGDHTADWTDATHAKKADADYDFVFDRSTVLRVDVTIAASDYAAMNDELDELLDQSGGPPEGEADPREAMDACRDLEIDDACTVEVDGVDTDGTCAEAGPRGELSCVVEGSGGGGGLSFTSADPSYVEATLTVDGKAWCHAGLRYKGNSSLQMAHQEGSAKLPFRVDFDRFEDSYPEVSNQGFYGFSDLSFGNNQGDDTWLRDVLASTILEDRGVPAARNRFAAVYLDAGDGETFLGVYTLMEDPSDEMMRRLFGDNDGNLYKGDGDCGDLTCYDAESFESKTNDEADGAEIQALVDALKADRSDAAGWRAGLEATLDVPSFLRWLAVNTAIENWDVYGAMAHNYYLYALPGETQLRWVPWDHNLSMMDAFAGSTDPLLADVGADWPLIRYVLDDSEYAALYQEELARALDGMTAQASFEAQAEVYAAILEPWVVREEGVSERDWDDAYAELYDHHEGRTAKVREAIR
jgi:spore coat protein H